MRKVLVFLLLLCSAASLFGQADTSEATIHVDASQKASGTIPRTIFGTFHEPIRGSNYGGLWAQILTNPSFEESLWSVGNLESLARERPELRRSSHIGLPVPWEALHPKQGWRYEPRWGDAANSFRSLSVMAMPGTETGVRQAVYPPVQRVLGYTGYVYVKPTGGPVEVEVSIRRRNKPEEVFAKAVFTARGGEWGKHEFQLELPAGKLSRNEPADFVIALSDNSRALIDQAMLYPADHIEGFDPEMVRLSRALKTPVLRYGGNYTSGYHWRDGVGPMDKRVSMINQAWGIPEYNHFGTDEFLRFCELIDAEPQICVNLGSGSPREAAGWVRYVNLRWGNRRGGLLWELGNELWGDWQIGRPTLDQIAERTQAFSRAIQRADPRARLIATGQDPDRHTEWNAQLLKVAPQPFSYIATHFVVGDDVVKKDPSPDFRIRARLALPVALERLLRSMNDQIAAHPAARDKVKIAFTEWLFAGESRRVPHFDNMGGALCAAGFLNTLMRVADFTPVSNMTGLVEFGGMLKRRATVFAVPAYWAFRMYSTSDIHRLVETRAEVDSYDVREGNSRIPEILDVPYLDVVSALNEAGDKLTLFCVNRKTNGAISAKLKISGFRPAGGTAAELRAGSVFAQNSEWRPNAVRPRTVEMESVSGSLDYEFPPASVTVLTLNAR